MPFSSLSSELRTWSGYGVERKGVHVIQRGQVTVEAEYFGLIADEAAKLEARIKELAKERDAWKAAALAQAEALKAGRARLAPMSGLPVFVEAAQALVAALAARPKVGG